MRTWFNRHPNVTFLLLGVWSVWTCSWMLAYARRGDWGWAGMEAGAFLYFSHHATKWWRRT